MDNDANAPCSTLAEFHQGKLTDFDAVMKFGGTCDIITIEIENVNTTALKKLAKQGKKVYPQPEVIELIQDKRTQKIFYRDCGIPTANFIIVENANDIAKHLDFFPAVNKLGREGYDGRGVQLLRSLKDIDKAFDAPGLLEELIDFDREISVIVARGEHGEVKTFSAVEMKFHPQQNLVEYLFAPAELSADILSQAEHLAEKIIHELAMVGVLAVEMFVTKDGKLLVNEIAPRPHNSGHHTIEANVTSQYEQHLRAILGMPLGDTTLVSRSAMVNLLGEPGHTGLARYEGFDEVVKTPGVHVHLYGKRFTKPFRKMGHVTIVDADAERLKKKAKFVKDTLKVTT